MVTYEFTRELRLLTPSQFQSVFQNATRFSSKHFTILISPASTAHARVGFAVAKKRVKLAVQRNRIKRIVKESFRLQQHNLPHVDIVVMVKSGIDNLENTEINQQITSIWRKIQKRHKK